MIVEKPIDHATYLMLENQIVIMQALYDANMGTRSVIRAHIDSTNAAMCESDRLRRAEAEFERTAYLRS